MPAKPLSFGDLSIDDSSYGEDLTRGGSDSETRLMEMLAAQAAHAQAAPFEDEEAMASDQNRTEEGKKEVLQRALNMAASNGNTESVKKLLHGIAKRYIDVNAPDEDGTPPLIYASCFVGSIATAAAA